MRSLSLRGVSCTTCGLDGTPGPGASVRLELRGVCLAVVSVASGSDPPAPTSVSVLGPDEEPEAGLAWSTSRHAVFNRFSEQANRVALPHFARASGEASDAVGASALECLLLWLTAYSVRERVRWGLGNRAVLPFFLRAAGPG